MADQPQNPTELDVELPTRGVFLTAPHHRLPSGFTADANNVFAFGGVSGRQQVGVRPGTSKYFPTSGTNAVNFGQGTNGAFIQYLSQVNAQDTSTGATHHYLIIVCAGRAYRQEITDTTTNRIDGAGAATFSAGRRVEHAFFQNVSYFTDGLTVQKYDHQAGTMAAWGASAGAIPIQGARYARYICIWRGRMVHAFFEKGTPGILFFSAMNDPSDYNYGGTNTATTAFATNTNFRAGQMGQTATALIPASEDVLLVGLDHGIYEFRGDPGAGGSLMPVSETVGILNNDAWCEVEGTIYFVGTGGFYRMSSTGGRIEKLSAEALQPYLGSLAQVGWFIECEYDRDRDGIWVFVTKETSPYTTRHFWYDLRAERAFGVGGFWPVSLPADTGGDDEAHGTTAPSHGPTKAAVFDGYSGTTTARVVLLGCRDGYVRKVDDAALDDDGSAILSRLWMGPMQPAGASREFLINGWRPVLGERASTGATWTLQGGPDPYSASNAATVTRTGTFAAGGRQGVLGDRLAANSAWLAVTNSTDGQAWAIERVSVNVEPGGPAR